MERAASNRLVIDAARGSSAFTRVHGITVVVGKFDRATAGGQTQLLRHEGAPGPVIGVEDRIVKNPGRICRRERNLIPLHSCRGGTIIEGRAQEEVIDASIIE